MQIADDKNEWNCRFGNERRNKRREKAKTYRHNRAHIKLVNEDNIWGGLVSD